MKVALSFTAPAELKRMLVHRAEVNNRSLTGEIVYLIETALALKSESTREMVHFLYKSFPAEDESSSEA